MMTPKRLARELEARLDGPHADEHTTWTADLAAEAIRYLNYATGSHSPEALRFPATAYDIATDLSIAARRMPQLFDQLARWLDGQLAAGMLGTDSGVPADDAVNAARLHLLEAAGHAARLSASLTAVQNDPRRRQRARSQPREASGMSLTTSAVTTAAAVTARPSWAEERRLDRAERARLDRERDDAAAARRIAGREAAQRLRQSAAEARRAQRAEAAGARAARLADLAAWTAGHVTGLLLVPVIAVPALLAWTAMAAYGAHLYGPYGRALPAFSEGAMWAFAAAVTITRHRQPGRPTWHLRAGTVVFAGFGAALNFAHGLSLGGPLTGAVMALVSVAGVTAHQLTTAGPHRPRHARADRDRAAAVEFGPDGSARLVYAAPAAEPTPDAAAPADTSPDTGTATARTPRRTSRPDTATAVRLLRGKHPDMTAADIAARLGITDRTVRRHLAAPRQHPPVTA